MIEKITDYKSVEKFLKDHFKSYRINDDPFEKIAIYTNEDIVGVVCYSIIYERGEINYIAVSSDNRGQGIASKLLEHALNDMIKSNCESVSLEVEKDNEPAINLYLKYGFISKAIRKNYYEGKDGYLMVRKLEVIK